MARRFMAVRLDEETVQQIREQSERTGVTISQLFRDLLVDGPAASAVLQVCAELSAHTGETVTPSLVVEQFIAYCLIQRIGESGRPLHPSDFENRTARELCAIYLAWREGCRALDGEPNPDGTLTKYKLVEYPAGGEWERLGRVGYWACVFSGDQLTADGVLLSPSGFDAWLRECAFDPAKLTDKQRDGLRGLYERELRRERTGETCFGMAMAGSEAE